MLNQNILLYGQEVLPPKPVALRAGPLTMIFEPDTAFVRYIRLGDHEMVRNIYAVVRDHNWNTIPWQVRDLKVETREDAFDIAFEADCEEGGVRYVWRGAVSGTAEGRVTFSFDGEAKSDFLRNRIGICVLHPILECAGKPCSLEHTDGAVEPSTFPKLIEPNQPFFDVRAITHEVAAGVRCEVRFEGEVFETEDQRNFGDASYKTYSTPQALPKPAQVKTGDRVRHRVTVTLVNLEKKKVLPVVQGRPPQISISTSPIVPKPALGLQRARDGHRLTEREAERIRALQLTHLRADVALVADDWRDQLRAASEEANLLRVPLHLALHVGANADGELTEFVREAEVVRPRVGLWIIQKHGESFPRNDTVQLARKLLAPLGPTLIAAAASPFYAEFNRNRPSPDFAALPCVPCTPQIHLTDRNTLIENIAAATEFIETAATITPQQVVMSPITLKRAEPKASKIVGGKALPPTVDTRQGSLFAAAWTVAHLAQIATATHLHSATYFETVGWRGVMESEGGSASPEKFFSIPGAVFPVYHVVADLAGFNRVCPSHPTLPLEVAGLTLLDAQNRRRILAANLQPHAQELKIKTGSCSGRMRRLNAGNAEEAMRTPEAFRATAGEPVQAAGGKIEVKLEPYEIIRLDLA